MFRGTYWTVAALIVAVTLWPACGAQARDQVRIVGSSTVYPFAATVAEHVGRMTRFKAPVIESTGSGGGFQTFCEGSGPEFVDLVNASRPIRPGEAERCAANRVGKMTEVKIGLDGIILGNSRKAPQTSFTRAQIFLALAKQVPVEGRLTANPYRKWSDIDGDLPATDIRVYGPPPTSGTRDEMVELIMEAGCEGIDGAATLGLTGVSCHALREDGAFIESGENDVLIAGKLQKDPDAFGIFGFNVLDQNMNLLQGASIDGVEPTFESIADGSYPVTRTLFFYVKDSHVGNIAGLKEYVLEFTSEAAFGPDGYLADKGLVPLPDDERKRAQETVRGIDGTQ